MRFPIPHIAAASLLLLAACQAPRRRWEPTQAAGAAPTVTNNCDSRDRNATLTGRVLLTFRGAVRGEAVVRIEGEAYESTVRMDVATGSTLELREGNYRLRADVSGYRTVVQNVRVICGKEQPLDIRLSGR